jgi:hypothetical protein
MPSAARGAGRPVITPQAAAGGRREADPPVTGR